MKIYILYNVEFSSGVGRKYLRRYLELEDYRHQIADCKKITSPMSDKHIIIYILIFF